MYFVEKQKNQKMFLCFTPPKKTQMILTYGLILN